MQPDDLDAFAETVVLTMKAVLTPVLERLAAAEARLSAFPTTEKTLTEIRDRVLVVETKSAMPIQVVESAPVDLTPVLERLTSVEARQADLKDRVLVVETKTALPVQIAEAVPVDLAPVLERLTTVEARLVEVDKYAARIEGYTSFLQRDAAALSERVAVVEVRPPVPGPAGEPGPPGQDGLNGKDGTAGLSFEGVYQDGKSYELGNLVTWGGSSWHCNEPTSTKPGDGSKAWTLMVKRGRDGRDGHDAPSLPVVSIGGRAQ